MVQFHKKFIYFVFLSVFIMSEFDAHIQEPHDEEGLEEEDPNPSDILQPSLEHDLVQKGVLPQRSVQEGNSMGTRRKFTVNFRAWLGSAKFFPLGLIQRGLLLVGLQSGGREYLSALGNKLQINKCTS